MSRYEEIHYQKAYETGKDPGTAVKKAGTGFRW